jgi:hypothetical protein
LELPILVYNGSSLNIKNSKIEGLENNLVNIFKNSSAILDNIDATGDTSYIAAFSVYDGSSLNIKNSNMDNIYNGFEAYSNSSFSIIDSSIECENNGIVIYENSSLNISGGTISCQNDGIALYNEAKANIDGVKITNALDVGIIAYNNTDPNPIVVTGSEIANNNYGFVVFNSRISAHQNSIHDNFTNGAFTFIPTDLDFINNYWGDKTGPTHSSNASGLGDAVSDNISFVPFLESDPLIEKIKNPVIIIPGITGTYLNKNYDDKGEIWPNIIKMLIPGDDNYLNDLVLNIDGTEKGEFQIVPGDIIRGIINVHVFDGLISELEEKGEYVEGRDLFVFPYDWRKSTSENANLLKEKINQIILDSGFGKVDIIAHSMGGLIAKKYIADNGENKIDQLIFLGTPQLGAPKAFKVLMFGDNMGYKFLVDKLNILNPSKVKYISQNMPSVYELLPSSKYIDLNGSYLSDVINKSDFIDLDYTDTKYFLIDEGRNPLMFPFAEGLHDSIDFINLSNIKSYNFVGCGIPTIGKIKVKKEKSWIGKLLGEKEDYDIGYTDGDETVPLVSSIRTIESEIYYAKGISHGFLPSADGVKENILAILEDRGLIFGDVLRDDDLYCGIDGDVVSTHSPVELHIYDKHGNHTGPDENGDIEYGIIGVQYDVIDDENYVFLPKGSDYKIIIKATDVGGFNLKIEKQEEEEILNTNEWTLIPLKTLKAIGEIWIGPNYLTTDYKVKMDNNGDGVIDEKYPVSFDGTKLAEEAFILSKTKSRRYSSGSIPLFNNQVLENPLLTMGRKFMTENIFKVENIDKKEVIININKQDISKDEKLNNSNLVASVIGTGMNIKFVWLLIILVGFALLIIAKIFIKL